MENAKKHYWGITEKGKVILTGSFNECWRQMVYIYSERTLKDLAYMEVKITRVG